MWRRQSGRPWTSYGREHRGSPAQERSRPPRARAVRRRRDGRAADGGGDGEREAAGRIPCPDQQSPDRPFGLRMIRRNAVLRIRAAAGIDRLRRISPGFRALRWAPRMKSSTGMCRAPPSADQIAQVASSARGERDHRPCRQREAEIAADRGGVPDLERAEQGAAALPHERCRDPGRRQVQAVELREGAGCGENQTVRVDRVRRPREAREVNEAPRFILRLGVQPCPAREARVAGPPRGQVGPAARRRTVSIVLRSIPRSSAG